MKWEVLAELRDRGLFIVPGAYWVSVRRVLVNQAEAEARADLLASRLCVEAAS